MRNLVTVYLHKIMYLKLYTPNGTHWTVHSKYKSHNDAVSVLKDLRNGCYRKVLLLVLRDDGLIYYTIHVVDAVH